MCVCVCVCVCCYPLTHYFSLNHIASVGLDTTSQNYLATLKIYFISHLKCNF